MAFTSPLDFQPPSTFSAIDRKPASSFDDIEPGDSLLLDSAMLSPTTTADRRESFGTFMDEEYSSPTTTLPDRHYSMSYSFQEQPSHPFRVDSATFGHNAAPWFPFDRSSDSRTPVAPTAYQVSSELAFTDVGSATSAFGGLQVQSNVQPSAIFSPTEGPSQFETSPTDTKDWMSMAEHAVDARHVSKRLRNESPPRSYSPFHKRDGNGIRKKTARFDIPPERTKDNIDELISNCHDEEQLKELKQQKRLLRNRQAALDSRQRKKQHAENLEQQNKEKADQICIMEEELRSLRFRVQSQEMEKDQMIRAHADLSQKYEQMENLVREQTIESGELRKKVNILTERLNESDSGLSSHSNTGEFADFSLGMGNLNMGNDFDEFTFINDLNVDSDMPPAQNQSTLVVAPRKKDTSIDAEQPVASGLLFMLLLCGAWVASRSSASSPPPNIKMPDEMREVSTSLLETVFKDAGVAPSQTASSNAVAALEPGPSGTAWPSFNSMADASDHLSSFARDFIAPTKDQEAQQAFSMSAREYSSVTNADFARTGYSSSDEDAPFTPQSSHSVGHRRNLAEALKAIRDEAKGQSAADVYTRSLLWDRIPTDVVHEFKRMVEESNALATANAGGG